MKNQKEYQCQPGALRSQSWRQVLAATIASESMGRNLALFFLWMFFAWHFVMAFLTCPYENEPWDLRWSPLTAVTAAFPIFLTVLMLPQCIVVRQHNLPGGTWMLFCVHSVIAFAVGAIPLGVIFFCVGNHGILALGIYFFAMALLPASLLRIHPLLYGLLILYVVSLLVPTPPSPELFSAFVFVAGLAFWTTTWRQVFRGWSVQEMDLKLLRRQGNDEEYEEENLKKDSWHETLLKDYFHQKIANITADRFWRRVRVRLLAYGDFQNWFSEILCVVGVVFLFWYQTLDEDPIPWKPSNHVYIFITFTIVMSLASSSLARQMARWQETIPLDHLLPRSKPDVHRETIVQFATLLVKGWLLFVLLFGVIALYFWSGNSLIFVLSCLAFISAFLLLQLGDLLLFLMATRENFITNLSIMTLIPFGFFALLWYWLGWPVTVGLVVLGVVVNYAAYRRLCTIEPDQIGK